MPFSSNKVNGSRFSLYYIIFRKFGNYYVRADAQINAQFRY